MQKRLLQIYTGPGKGKTTAATGLILRALGQGWKVLLVRFLKPAEPVSGEMKILRQQPGLDIIDAGLGGIYNASDVEAIKEDVQQTFLRAKEQNLRSYDLVVFDEFNGLFRKGYLSLEDALAFIDARPQNTELVLTGRHAPSELIERADLVTSMEALRHPLEKGLGARQGIEF